MQTLHKPDSVFSLRHAPSWLMLTFAAGAVNAMTLLACARFVTHVTGTVTRLGVELAHWTIALDFALVVFCFIAGAMVAGLLINGRAHRGKRPLFALPLWITATVTAAMAIAGASGWLGAFGGAVDEPGDFLLLSGLSFAMGLQNAAVATSTGLLVRTTHLTGPATDLGMHLAELLFARGEARAVARRHAALRAGKVAAFALGAAVAVPLAHRLGFLAFLLPALVTATATFLSFVPSRVAVQPG
jgi:uncharacterized membrane protein YoaK (UPF0700 family)